METKGKDLLLKDLCARLPYETKGLYYSTVMSLHMVDPFDNYHPLYCVTKSGSEYIGIDEFKPYLLPLSSMTEEQQEEFDRIYANDMQVVADNLKNRLDGQPYEINLGHYRHIDWLNANHFDYRCLIEKGLAIDATGLNIY